MFCFLQQHLLQNKNIHRLFFHTPPHSHPKLQPTAHLTAMQHTPQTLLQLPNLNPLMKIVSFIFKGARSYFLQFNFIFYSKDHHTKDVNLKFQLNWSNRLYVVSNNFVYCTCLYNYYVSFIMHVVTITRHFFINIL